MYKDRIVELRRVRAGDLVPAPLNWRKHPKAQQDAMKGILDEIGYADAVLARETPRGLELIDGHLRTSLDDEQVLPVLILDLNDEEATKMLLTLDPLAAMAETDADALAALLADVTFSDEAITAMLDALGSDTLLPMTDESAEDEPFEYSNKIISPVYEITGENPALSDLYDETKTKELRASIEAADIPDEIATFLYSAAERHTRFNFKQIAECYAHADADVQRLMESSALVIIDFDRAIEEGFIDTVNKITQLADEDNVDDDYED
jgi:hypothetical protein